MKRSHATMLALGLMASPVFSLEPPEKVEPLAPNQAPQTEEVTPAAEEKQAEVAPAAEPKNVEKMPMAEADKAYMGLGMEPLPAVLAGHLGLDVESCALVRATDPNGPAAQAGIQEHDVITAIDGKTIKCHACLCDLLNQHKPGDEVKVALIHRGQAAEKTLTLGAKPVAEVAGIDDCDPDVAVAPDVLEALPKEMRDMIEKNLKALGGDALGKAQIEVLPMNGGPNALPELQKRVEKMMKGMQLQMPPGGGLQIQPGKVGVQMKSTLNMSDDEGVIEVSRDGESAEAKVYDKQGNLLWSGPYQTPQDKEAVPPPIRERLDKLNIDVSGEGIQMRMQNLLPKPNK